MLQPIGTEGSFRWLGPGRCELRLERARRPFTGLRIVIWLRSRAILPSFLIEWLRGRSDLVAFAADLDSRPRIQFELVDRRSPVGQRALARTVQREWQAARLTWGGKDLDLLSPDVGAAQRFLREVSDRQLPTGIDVIRLAVLDHAPQINLTVAHPESLVAAGRGFEAWFRRFGESVAAWAA